MKLTKQKLEELIAEVLWDAVPVERTPADYKRKRYEDIFSGITDLRRLAKGIAEQDDDGDYIRINKQSFDTILDKLENYLNTIDEACGDDVEGNRLHTKTGAFGDKSTNTSWSLQDKGCGANSMTPGSNKRKWTKVPCGRAARKIKKNIRCRDGKELPW